MACDESVDMASTMDVRSKLLKNQTCDIAPEVGKLRRWASVHSHSKARIRCWTAGSLECHNHNL